MTGHAKTKEQLEAEGWQLASISSGAHLERTVEMYKELGFEIYLEEIDVDSCKECMECFKEGGEKPYRIYTRGK